MADKLVPAGAIWIRTAKNGSQYFNVTLEGGQKLVAFPNQYKKEDKHPDFKLFFSTPPEQEENVNRSGAV